MIRLVEEGGGTAEVELDAAVRHLRDDTFELIDRVGAAMMDEMRRPGAGPGADLEAAAVALQEVAYKLGCVERALECARLGAAAATPAG